MIIATPKGNQSLSTQCLYFVEAIVDEDHSKKQNLVILKTRPWEEDAPWLCIKDPGFHPVGCPLKSQLEALPTGLQLGS